MTRQVLPISNSTLVPAILWHFSSSALHLENSVHTHLFFLHLHLPSHWLFSQLHIISCPSASGPGGSEDSIGIYSFSFPFFQPSFVGSNLVRLGIKSRCHSWHWRGALWTICSIDPGVGGKLSILCRFLWCFKRCHHNLSASENSAENNLQMNLFTAFHYIEGSSLIPMFASGFICHLSFSWKHWTMFSCYLFEYVLWCHTQIWHAFLIK